MSLPRTDGNIKSLQIARAFFASKMTESCAPAFLKESSKQPDKSFARLIYLFLYDSYSSKVVIGIDTVISDFFIMGIIPYNRRMF